MLSTYSSSMNSWQLLMLFVSVVWPFPECHMVGITFPPTVQESSLFSTPSPAFIVRRFFNDGHSDPCDLIHHCGFDLHFSNNEWCWVSFYMLAICMSSLEKCLFRSFPHFLIEWFVFLILSCMNCLYILEINPLSVVSFAIIPVLRVVFSLCL